MERSGEEWRVADPNGPGPRPTLEAVAALAGVSRATVSRVVNGGAGVRAAVRERVHEAVAALGYVPNSAARSLVTRRTGAVAVVIAEPEARVFSDPFFGRQLRGIGRELAAADTQLLLMLVERPADYGRIGRYLSAGHVDGALMFSLHRDDPLPGMAERAGLPTVYGGRPGWAGADRDPRPLYVDTDNRDGARQAVRHLLGRGPPPDRRDHRTARPDIRGGPARRLPRCARHTGAGPAADRGRRLHGAGR